MDVQWLNDFSTWLDPAWVAASAAVAGGAAAWFAAINGRSTLRQVKRDSAERSRPQVAAELRDLPYSKGMQILVIRNVGATIARNVRVSFAPEIPDPENAAESVTPFLKRRYSSPIPALTSGMELDNLWYVGTSGEGGRFVNSEPTPDQAVVTITYEDGQGREFSDDFPIDVTIIRQRTYTESSSSPAAQGKEALKHLTAAAKAIGDIAKSARLLTADQRAEAAGATTERQQKHEDLARALGLRHSIAEPEEPSES